MHKFGLGSNLCMFLDSLMKKRGGAGPDKKGGGSCPAQTRRGTGILVRTRQAGGGRQGLVWLKQEPEPRVVAGGAG